MDFAIRIQVHIVVEVEKGSERSSADMIVDRLKDSSSAADQWYPFASKYP